MPFLGLKLKFLQINYFQLAAIMKETYFLAAYLVFERNTKYIINAV